MTTAEYLKAPCRALSIPLWKARRIQIPDFLKIVHGDEFQEGLLDAYSDTPYFRLIHDLQIIPHPELPAPFVFGTATVEEYAAHIHDCYPDLGVTPAELSSYARHPVHCPELWIAVRDLRTGAIAASGIAELDRDIGEGILEWVQVSPPFRSMGLGTCVVRELLGRMQGRAAFATVSGRQDDPCNPEGLYRKCGFTGSDVWHILRKH